MTQYSVDGNDNVTAVTLPTGRQIRMSYAGNGDLASVTDERGLVTTMEYDSYGNPTKTRRQVESGPEIETINTFDSRSRLRTSSDTLAPSTTIAYDAMDRIKSTTESDPSGFHDAVATTYGYKAAGQIASMSVDGQAGGSSSQSYSVDYHYDALDRTDSITETANGAGSFTRSFNYDSNSNLTSETDRRGVATSYAYDELNFVNSATVNGGFGQAVRATFTPNKVGLPTTETDIYGQTTTNGYDGLHRLTGRTYTVGAASFTESVTLDANGNARAFRDRNWRTTRLNYDSLNRVEQVTDPRGRTSSWVYDDSSGTVTMQSAPQGLTRVSRTDALGRPLAHTLRFGTTEYASSYSYAGHTVTMIDPRQTRTVMQLSAFGQVGAETMSASGTSLTLSTAMRYSALGGMRSFTDARNGASTYTLDGLNRVTVAQYPGIPAESFTYDGEGNLLSHRDSRGVISAMQYDNIGRLRSNQTTSSTGTNIPGTTTSHVDIPGIDTVTDPDGVQASFPFASKQIDTDPLGHVTVKRFDALRRMISLTNAESRSKTYDYDGANLTRETDFKGRAVLYRYDDLNRLIEITDRLNQLTTIGYDDTAGLTTTITDRRGNQRVEVRDPLGRITSVTLGGQLLGRYEYDSNNNRTAMIDGRNNRTSYTYDAFNRVTQINHADIQTEILGYDSNGNTTSYNDGRGGVVRQEFDELNRMTARIDSVGNRTEYHYDGRGLLTEMIEPKRDGSGNPVSRTAYEYNALGSLTKVTDANQGVWVYRYDDDQKLVGITDAEGRPETTFDYDSMHRLTKVTRPLGPAGAPAQPMQTRYEYDANSNRKLTIDPMGRRITTTFDALDRARDVSIVNADSSLPSGRRGYTMDYDPEGNLTSVTERVGLGGQAVTRNYSRTYDSRNRLGSATDPLGLRVSYLYDSANNVTNLTDAANRQTSYTYDAMNRLDIATLPGGRSVNYDWTVDGLLSKVTYGNGMQRVYGYDDADRVTSIVNTLGGSDTEEFTYGYDANSNRETETRKLNGATTRSLSYQYDALNRLTRANYGGGAVVNWAYDKVGNRISESGTEVGGAAINRTYSHDELNRLRGVTDTLDSSRSLTLDYDLNGNLTKEHKPNGDERRFEYDSFNQMLRAASFVASTSTETELGSYDYDFEGRRISRTAQNSTLQYIYSGINVVNEFSGSTGQVVNSYDYGADLVRGELGGEGERLYFHDALGSTTALSSSSGSTVARYEYDAWGKLISASQPSSNRVNFTGYRHDDETSFEYAMARYYDSGMGRFTSFDPVTESDERLNMPQGLNLYSYVMGNPSKYIDPTGLDWAVRLISSQNGVSYYQPKWFKGRVPEKQRREGWITIKELPFEYPSKDGKRYRLYAGGGWSPVQEPKAKPKKASRKAQAEPTSWKEAGVTGVIDYSLTRVTRSMLLTILSAPEGLYNLFAHPVDTIGDVLKAEWVAGKFWLEVAWKYQTPENLALALFIEAKKQGVSFLDPFLDALGMGLGTAAAGEATVAPFRSPGPLPTIDPIVTQSGEGLLKVPPKGATPSGVPADVQPLSVAEANRLSGPNRGIIFVRENLGKPGSEAMRNARDFEAGTEGAFSELATQDRVVPALRYDNPNPAGSNIVKFDGIEGSNVLIDAKTRVLTFESRGQQIIPQADDLRRMSEALRQNPDYTGVIEFPDAAAAQQAIDILNRLGIRNIPTRVRK